MNRTITRVKIIFFGLFLAGSLGMLGYHLYFVWPARNCDAQGGWWDPKDHLCASPMPIWRITGRAPAVVAARQAASKADPAAPAAKP